MPTDLAQLLESISQERLVALNTDKQLVAVTRALAIAAIEVAYTLSDTKDDIATNQGADAPLAPRSSHAR